MAVWLEQWKGELKVWVRKGAFLTGRLSFRDGGKKSPALIVLDAYVQKATLVAWFFQERSAQPRI